MGSDWREVTLGDQTGEWKTLPLIECTSDGNISYGIVQPGQDLEDGIPIVRVNNFKDGRLDLSSVLRVAPEIEDKFRRTRLSGGEVLLTLVGSTGQSAIVPPKMKGWNVPRAIAVIKPKHEIGANWINIFLQTREVQEFLDARANTTVQKTLNLKDVREIPIRIPPPSEKRFIESCIGSLDDKIELNRKQNATLEAMAQALFQSWFVDFDPVIDKALAAGNEIPEPLQSRAARRAALGNRRKPLPADIADLFPDRFVETEEMGWVPEGWGVGTIRKFCQRIQNGGTPNRSQSEYWEGGKIPWLASGEVRQNIVIDSKETITEEGLANSSAKWIPKFSTVVAMYGATAGQVALLAASMTTNQAICSLVPIDDAKFFNYLLLSRSVSLLANMARGSAQQNISKGIIEDFPAIYPSNLTMAEFDRRMDPLFEQMIANIQESTTLTQLRDTLLPKLISGEIRVGDVENLVSYTARGH